MRIGPGDISRPRSSGRWPTDALEGQAALYLPRLREAERLIPLRRAQETGHPRIRAEKGICCTPRIWEEMEGSCGPVADRASLVRQVRRPRGRGRPHHSAQRRGEAVLGSEQLAISM